jgi:hypothetical protein
MIDCHAGLFTAAPSARKKVSIRRTEGVVIPAIVIIPSINDITSIQHCVAIRSRRLSIISANAPAGSARRKNGNVEAV